MEAPHQTPTLNCCNHKEYHLLFQHICRENLEWWLLNKSRSKTLMACGDRYGHLSMHQNQNHSPNSQSIRWPA